MLLLYSSAISDLEDDNDDDQDNLEEGIDAAEEDNGTKGSNHDVCIYILTVVLV